MKLEIGIEWTRKPNPGDPNDETEHQLLMLDEYLDQTVTGITKNYVATTDSKENVRYYRKQ